MTESWKVATARRWPLGFQQKSALLPLEGCLSLAMKSFLCGQAERGEIQEGHVSVPSPKQTSRKEGRTEPRARLVRKLAVTLSPKTLTIARLLLGERSPRPPPTCDEKP